jgi:hypothetical protein
MRLREITVRGFKSVVEQSVSLGRVNCFIGANGVGKSNLLDALGVLGAAAAGRVDDETIIRRGVRAGLPRLFKTSFADTPIPPHINLEARGEPSATFRVALLNPLDQPKPAWAFKTEILSSGEAPVVSRGVRSDRQNLDESRGLAALRLVDLPADDPASKLLRTLQEYVIYSPSTPTLRATVPDPQTRLPVGLSGGGLAEGIAALEHEADEAMLDDTLSLIDWVSGLGVTEVVGELLSPSVPRTQNVLRFTDRFMATSRNALSAADASEGALYVLFAAVLCLSRASPPVFAIDNLDTALNPRLATALVRRLAGWLEATDPDRQLLFTAHNPAALDGLDLEDDEVRLFAMERTHQGHASIRRITLEGSLRKLNETYPLSRLWVMGHLGAVAHV